MSVLTGARSHVIASCVDVYQPCLVDLQWQRTIHSCQRCPRAVLTASVVSMQPITQPSIERAQSRFCPAGVHMGTCVPASNIFSTTNKQAGGSKSTSALANANSQSGGGLSVLPSVWGPPNLPVPAFNPHHPIHAVNLARASYPPGPTSNTTDTFTGTTPTKATSSTVHHFTPVRKPELPLKTINSESDGTVRLRNTSAQPLPAAPITPPPSSPGVTDTTLPQTGPPKVERIVTPSITIVREPKKTVATDGVLLDNHITPPSETTGGDIDKSTPSDQPVSGEDIVVAKPKSPSEKPEPVETPSEPPLSEPAINKKPKKDEAPIHSQNGLGPVVDNGPGRTPIKSSMQTAADDLDKAAANKTTARSSVKSSATPIPGTKGAAETVGKTTDGPSTTVVANHVPTTPSATLTATNLRDTREQARRKSQTPASPGSGGLGDGTLAPKPTIPSDGSQPNGPEVRPAPSRQTPGVIPSPSLSMQKSVPSFHFPLGTTRMSRDEMNVELDRVKKELLQLAESLPDAKRVADPMLVYENIGQIAKALNCPLYWKSLVYSASGGSSEREPIAMSAVLKMWTQVLSTTPDESARFVHMLTKGRTQSLTQADFNPLIQDILESHPGLAFLQAAKDFHSRYVATVVARIFFNVNTSWSGRISLGELRRSNFLFVLASLEDEEDINLVTQYFSYEHFYVIYCKFWELDDDHDLIISRADLARHNNYAISERMIDRIFSGTVTRGTAFKGGVMTYPDFVWFLLAEEDKRHPRSVEYWFRCMDLDGDGLLSMYELEYFYSEQVARMEEMGIEPISFEDCLCQCLDMVKPELGDKIRLSDMKQCRLCHIFFDTFFNLPKYLQHEQRDPFSNLRDIEEGLNELSDWDRYAAEAYEMLVAVEGGNQDDGVDEDEEEDDDEEGEEEAEGEDAVIARGAVVANDDDIDEVHALDTDDADLASSHRAVGANSMESTNGTNHAGNAILAATTTPTTKATDASRALTATANSVGAGECTDQPESISPEPLRKGKRVIKRSALMNGLVD